jgi:hypothetical protein
VRNTLFFRIGPSNLKPCVGSATSDQKACDRMSDILKDFSDDEKYTGFLGQELQI